MSLYIPGLNLPPKGEKPITLMIFHDGSIWDYDDEAGSVKVIEIPEHGRLVDETQILKLIDEQRNWEYNKTHSPNMTWSRIFDAYEWIMQRAATIIPADEADEEVT